MVKVVKVREEMMMEVDSQDQGVVGALMVRALMLKMTQTILQVLMKPVASLETHLAPQLSSTFQERMKALLVVVEDQDIASQISLACSHE